MSSVIILTQNNMSVEFWQQKLSIVNLPIYKFETVAAVLKASPKLVIIDNYFLGHENLLWMNKQVSDLKNQGYKHSLICLSPQFTSTKEKAKNKDGHIYRHHFNQSFIDRVSIAAVA